MDLRDLDRRALAQTDRFVAAVTVADLDKPTPCAGWSLDELLRHMVAQQNGWAEAAGGAASRREVWEDAALGEDPYRTYRTSTDRVLEAFAAPDLMDRRFDVYGYGVFPATVALGMHFVDYLVHGWDVAKALGGPDGFDDDLGAAALRIALRWPYDRPDKAFGVRVEVADEAPAHHRLMAYLGRSPAWPEKVS